MFALSPRIAWSWRRALLRAFGAKVGHFVNIYPNVRIAIPWNLSIGDNSAVGDGAVLYCLGPMAIGRDVTISQGAHLCGGSHDYKDATMPLMKCPIVVENGAWICADAFVGPGVRIGELAVVAARAVVVRDVEAMAIVAGNPAHKIKAREAPTRPRISCN